MKLTRRTALYGVAGAVLATSAGLHLARPGVASHIARIFGDETANLPAAKDFIAAYDHRLSGGAASPVDVDIARQFMMATNFYEHHTTGAPLEFDALYNPYAQPCANRLSALYAPEGEHV